MTRRLPLALALVVVFLAPTVRGAAPATRPTAPIATVRPETWEQDNERLKAQVTRLTATVAELEKRPAPATRPSPTTATAAAPTSRPVG
jgi:hypothetical protein